MNTFCSYYNQGICSSCSRIELPYPDQIELKNEKLTKLLDQFTPFELLPPVQSTNTYFRNKAKFTVTGTMENPVIGLTGEMDLDQGREILDCPLHHPLINQLVHEMGDFIRLCRLKPYQIKSREGELKGIIIYASESKEMYLRLILRSKESLDRIKKHLSHLKTKFPQLSCLSANIQPIPHAVLEGDEEYFFTPQHYIHHQMGEVSMNLHPQGFVQTNQSVARQLYSTAAAWTKEVSPGSFVELFSGQGAFSFFIQKYVKSALGVEINKEAVERANQTAQEMNWSHLKFVAEDAAKVKDLVVKFSPDLILVNPPRRGMGQAIEILKEVKSRYFIYSSCNAETMAQDIKQLKDNFRIRKVQLFDMFPHTDHFETLVLLESISTYRSA